MFGVQSWEQIVDQSTKIIKFIDLGGKIIFDGLCSQFPEFCLLCISSQTGISKNSIEYLKYSLIIQIPIIIVITQIDLINEQSLEEIVYGVQKMIKNVAPNKIPLVVRDEESVVLFSRMLLKEQILPIFLVIK